METPQLQDMTLGQLLQTTLGHQMAYMETFLQFVGWCKTYARSGRMLSRVCLANAPAYSEAERDAQALTHHLTDIEQWLEQHEAQFQERYIAISQFVQECLKQDLSHPSDTDRAAKKSEAAKKEAGTGKARK